MRRNNKGFTLIELLAVIVIMGILMIIAIPMMTRYIENSRKDTFVSTAKAYINGARYQYLGGEFSCNNAGTGLYYVRLCDIDIDSGGTKSSFGADFKLGVCTTPPSTDGYVLMYTDSTGKTKFAVAIRDAKGNGFTVTEETSITRNTVVKETYKVDALADPNEAAAKAAFGPSMSGTPALCTKLS